MYQVVIKRQAIKEIGWQPQQIQDKVIHEIDNLKTNPRPFGSKKLHGSEDRWRIRIGNYRVLYKIDDAMKQVYIYRALHREEAYR